MKIKYAFSLVCILIVSSSFLTYSSKITIYISEYDYSFTPQKEGCIDTLTKTTEDGRELRITLFDCRGKMHLQCFKNKVKIEEGDYINSLDLLKKYINRIDGIKGNQTIKVYEFYQPLRSGTWVFYDKKGKLLRKEIYKDGVIQK